MAYKDPMTIAEVLDKIRRHDYVLPAIQREFVWKSEKIELLFDSLMRGYPIGSFLFWKVEREHVGKFKYYDFVREFHRLKARHCPPLDIPADRDVIAVLDGQQRFTAFNIGLRGRHAEKLPRKWKNNPDAYPWKYLYLNLLRDAPNNEEGMTHEFRFLTPQEAEQRGEEHFWFRVQDILGLEDGPDLLDYLYDRNVQSKFAFKRLHQLHDLIHRERVVHYYLEESQDPERALDIFIRVNSAGTVLSYSDLLLSIATAQWKELSARDRIHELVDALRETGDGFDFSKDFVLKAGLMLADIASVGFRVTNFTERNMLILEEKWSQVEKALRLAVRLVADFGFSGQTLSAHSAVLPIAYYLYHRNLTTSYLTRRDDAQDREAIRGWLIRSLLKPGIWGSGLDVTLTALRSVIQEHGDGSFPLAEIEAEMARRGRAMRFEEEEIEDLLDTAYGDRRIFALLALLYPFVDLRNQFHIDHIFPSNAFDRRKLKKLDLPDETLRLMIERKDLLPNLQLLEGPFNQAKRATMPANWLVKHIPDETTRAEYMRRHDMPPMPADVTGFLEFFAGRRAILHRRLRSLLGAPTAAPTVAAGAPTA